MKENTEEYRNWLKTLKEGDKGYYHDYSFGKRIVVVKIKKITPTGKIRLEGGELLVNGRYSPSDRWSRNFTILPLTEEVLKEKELQDLRNEIYSRINKIDLIKCTEDELKQLCSILENQK